MKKILTTLFMLSLLSFAQENPTTTDETKKKPAKPQYIIELEALTRESRGQYLTLYREADQLFKQKRIFECLNKINALHQIYDGNPASLNLQGACYVEFRSFKKARKAFTKALAANEGNINLLFNLAEINFVSKNYHTSLVQLQELKAKGSEIKAFDSMSHLVDFKILLCKLKTGDEAGAKKMVDATDFLDDSPLFYYGNAALEYFADNRVKAEVLLARAGRIFTQPSVITPWQDTLVEFGYIKSFYGGDLEIEVPSAIGE